MAKRMSGKLVEYNQEVFKDWWERNPDYARDMARRLSERYIVEEPPSREPPAPAA